MFLFCAHLAFLWLWDFLLKVPLILLFCYLNLITPFNLYCYPKVLHLNTVIFIINIQGAIIQPITSLKLNTHFYITLQYGRLGQHAFLVSVSLSFATWTSVASNHLTDPGPQWTHLHCTVTLFLLSGTLSLSFTLFCPSSKRYSLFKSQGECCISQLVIVLKPQDHQLTKRQELFRPTVMEALPSKVSLFWTSGEQQIMTEACVKGKCSPREAGNEEKEGETRIPYQNTP